MDIHEYQAKELLAGFGVPIRAGRRGLQPRAGGL
jgi:succinyl-CoA synthetase beta subunit